MQAVRDPHASFLPWLAAYARCASAGEAQRKANVVSHAQALSRTLGQALSEHGLRTLVRAGLLWHSRDLVALRRPYRPYWPYFHTQVLRLEGAAVFLASRQRPEAIPDELYRGLVLFDFGLFFACHEYFEGIWRESGGLRREFYKGLVQVAAAFYHHEKGNRHGAITLLQRAIHHLQTSLPEAQGLDVPGLLGELGPWLDRFSTGGFAPYPVLVAGS